MLCWLILCSDVGEMDDNDGGNKGRVELVLILLSDLHSELNSILVGASSTLLVHLTPSTNYLVY